MPQHGNTTLCIFWTELYSLRTFYTKINIQSILTVFETHFHALVVFIKCQEWTEIHSPAVLHSEGIRISIIHLKENVFIGVTHNSGEYVWFLLVLVHFPTRNLWYVNLQKQSHPFSLMLFTDPQLLYKMPQHPEKLSELLVN